MFTLQTSFKQLLLGEEGAGGVKSVSRGDCEKQDFPPNYVQEFGLRTWSAAKEAFIY